MILMALGILVSPYIEKLWIKAVLAGFSTGVAVMEGFDSGAILSIYVAVFVVFWFLSNDTSPAAGARKTIYVGVLLVVSAFLISLSTISTLIVTQLKGTSGGGVVQSESAKRDAWDKSTQWSIPKVETLRTIRILMNLKATIQQPAATLSKACLWLPMSGHKSRPSWLETTRPSRKASWTKSRIYRNCNGGTRAMANTPESWFVCWQSLH